MTDGKQAFGGQLTPSPTNGAMLRPDYMARTSKVYAIYESEMDSLSVLNHVVTAFLALAASSLSFAGGLLITDNMSPVSTPVGKAIVALGVPGGIFFALVFALLAGLSYRKRGATLHAIKNESRQVPGEPVA